MTCCFALIFIALLGWERPQQQIVSQRPAQAIFQGEEDYHPLLIHIPSGHFIVDSLASLSVERLQKSSHHPRKVHIPYDFLIMSTELNVRIAYQLKKRSDYTIPSCMGDCPVINISWFEAVELANLLSMATGLESCYSIKKTRVIWEKGVTCLGYRLPLEEEWEYAAKAGIKTVQKDDTALKKEAWFKETSVQGVHPIATKQPNPLGIYDLHGNAAEWCWDIWCKKNKLNGSQRATRGGAWNSKPEQIQLGSRAAVEASRGNVNTGVRFVRTLPSLDSH